jgi:hypothetical protein
MAHPNSKLTTLERFWLYTDFDLSFGCWLWQGARDTCGYGIVGIQGSRVRTSAHRWAYVHWKGTIPAGLEIDHLCRTPNCVNPAHLEAVTRRENTRRGQNFVARYMRRERCACGAVFGSVSNGGRVVRKCLDCKSRYDNARYREKRNAMQRM